MIIDLIAFPGIAQGFHSQFFCDKLLKADSEKRQEKNNE